MAVTKQDVYDSLNATLLKYGYDAGNTPTEVTDDTYTRIAALPDSQLSDMFSEINRVLIDRWFSNGLNPSTPGLSRFILRDQGAHGFTITDRFINLISAGTYGTNTAEIASRMFDRADNPIEVKHFTDGYKKPYKATIDDQSFRKFLSADGLVQYVAWLEANLFTSAEDEMRTEIAAMMKAAVEAGQVVTVTGVDMDTENGLADLVEKMMTCVDAFRQPTTLYNVGERKMSTPDGVDVVIVTTPSRWNRVRARLYSDRYHLDQLYVNGQVLFAPEGTDLGTVTDVELNEHEVEFIVADARGWCIDVTTLTMKRFDVGSENYINAFLHVEGVKGSVPTFCNAVAFAGEYGDFREGGDSPEPEQKDIILTAISSAAGNNVLLNGDTIGNGTAIDSGNAVYAKTVPVKPGDIIAQEYDVHGSYTYIYTVAADGTRTAVADTSYTVTGDEYAILTFGYSG